MNNNWLKEGPQLNELVTERKDERRMNRSKLAIVIPTFQNKSLLETHLSHLERQSYQDFDIIIVYGEKDEFVETPPWASILHIREQGMNGCSGSFYIGEKAALEQGYQALGLADCDCFPESENLLEKLVEASRNGNPVVLPHVLYHPCKIPQKGYVIHHYGCLKAEVFKKAGLTFLPLFFGGDDFEMSRRIVKSGFSFSNVDALAKHPKNKPAYICKPGRKYYNGRGTVEALFLNREYGRALLFITLYLEMALVYFIINKRELAKEMFLSVWTGSGLEFFKRKFDHEDYLNQDLETAVNLDEFDIIIHNDEDATKEAGEKHWLSLPKSNVSGTTLKRIIRTFSSLLKFNKYFGARILLIDRSDPADLSMMILARSAHLRFQGKDYIIFKNRGALSIIFGIISLILLTPFIFAISFASAFYGFIKTLTSNVSSKGYGLDTKKIIS